MLSTSWRNWLKRLSSPHSTRLPKSPRLRKSRRLHLEALETRLAPATRTWSGLGGDNHWTDSSNWVNNKVPVAGDDLAFPSNAQQLSNFNDFTAGTNFKSITFTGGGYSVSGHDIVLGQGTGGSLVDSSGATNNKFNINIQFVGQSGTETFTATAGTVLTVSGQISGSSGFQLKKTNSGTVVLSGNNSGFSGPVTVNQGALQIQSATALGSNNATTVLSGAALQVKNVTGTITETLVLSGPGVGGAGALENVSGVNAISGNITFGSNLIIGADADQLTLSGTLADNGIGYTLTKEGQGEVVLAHANTYAGTTIVDNGILSIQDPSALGSTARGTTVNPGAALQVEGVSVSGESLTLNGPGVNNGGALRNVNGIDTWSGGVTLATNASIGVDGGSQLTITSQIRENTTHTNLTKEGTGTLFLTHANVYTGITEVHEGILQIQDPLAVGGSSADGVVVDGRASLETIVSVSGEALTLNGPGVSNEGALNNVSGDNAWSGNITLATDGSVGVDAGYQLTLSGVIGGPGGITKYLTGEAIFTNANTYLGSTDVNAGILTIENSTALGGIPAGSTVEAGTTVESGASLDVVGVTLSGTSLTVTDPLILAGPGVNSAGALDNINGTNTFTGDITLTDNTTIGVESGAGSGAGSQLTLTGDITERNGSFGLTKVGPNRLIVSGFNRYTGLTSVNAGTLTAASDNALGTTDNGTVVANGAALEIQGGIHIGAEALTLSGSGISNAGALLGVSDDNKFDGNITMTGNTTIGVNTDSRLSLPGVLTDNLLGFSLTKAGGGKLVLSGANSYGGGTSILAGIVNVQNSSALGSGVGATTVADGASIEFQEGVTIPNQHLTLHGAGLTTAENIPQRWFPMGPAPQNNVIGTNPGFSSNPQAASGRITAIAADPSNPNIIYIGAATGGIWKTKNAGLDWFPVTDNLPPLNIGSIAVSSKNPNIVYAGTGEGNYVTTDFIDFVTPAVSFYGDGVLKSTDGGATWSLLGQDHFKRQSIKKVVIDPTDPNTVYVATSSYSINGQGLPKELPSDPTGTGIWKTTDGGTTWTNTTFGPVWGGGTIPSIDDYTDLVMDPLDHKNLYFAIGTNVTDDFSTFLFTGNNSIGESLDGGSTWFLLKNFPHDTGGFFTGGTPSHVDGTIKIGIGATAPDFPFLYASLSDPFTFALKNFEFSVDGGFTWTNETTPNYLGGQGFYDSVVAVDPNNSDIVYAAGQQAVDTGVIEGFLQPNLTITWVEIGLSADGNSPHTDSHAFSFDTFGKLLIGTDGGIWRLADNNPRAPRWVDLNSNLQITQLFGVTVDPNNPGLMYAGAQDNGTMKFTPSTGWNNVFGGDGGITLIDPTNPSTVYGTADASLIKSTDGGANWSFLNVPPGPTTFPAVPLVMDPSNSQRLLTGTDSVLETTDGGNTWTALSTPTFNGWETSATIRLLAVASNNPNVIYAEAGGDIYVTLDHGAHWNLRDVVVNGVLINDHFGDLEVDPNNPLVAYIVRNNFNGWGKSPFPGLLPDDFRSGHVFRTTDGGQNWFDITGNLPDLPVWTLAIDPRPNPNILYIGTDQGVYSSTDLGKTWNPFGVGMPQTIVSKIILDQFHDYLLASTMGRGVFKLDLDAPAAKGGAGRSITGANSWTGDITMAADTTVGADVGTVLTFSGTIGDQGLGNGLTKVGQGTVVLTQDNTYGGPTTVDDGILVAQTSHSLGTNSLATVNSGGTLELQGDGLTIPQNLNLNGSGFNNIGALFNTAGNNTWAGNITLATQATATLGSIGVDSGSSLTVTGVIGEGNLNSNLSKEGPGLLVLTSADTYGGNTTIDAGDLNIQNVQALGTGTGGTFVNSGAALELQFPVPTGSTAPLNTISGETLTLNGDGLYSVIAGGFTGALHSISGNNEWAGNITLQTPSSIGVDNDGSSLTLEGSPLTISGVIGDKGTTSGLTKVGDGKLVLTNSNTYSGGTTVATGVINVQNSTALGTTTTGTTVDSGAAVEVQQPAAGPINVNQPITLNGAGIGGAGAIDNVGGNNTWSGAVSLGSASSIGVELDPTTGSQLILTVTGDITGLETSVLSKVGLGILSFPSANDYLGQTLVTAGILRISNSQALGALGGDGTFVTDGATLQLEEDQSSNPITVKGKTLGLTGTGYNGMGAVENQTGNNTWEGSILLDGSSTIAVDAGWSLTADRAIAESVLGSNLTKLGAGTLTFSGGTGFDNTYTGTTFVNQGTLALDKTGGALALSGNLVVGQTGGSGTATAQWQASNQVASSTAVTVNGNGTADLNGNTDTIAGLTITDGTFKNGAGSLTINGPLSMTGGDLNTDTTGQVTLLGDVTATSDAAAKIDGTGTLTLGGGVDRTFTVNAGPTPGANDLVISIPIKSATTEGLIKTGTGVLDLTAAETYAGNTTVNAGTLLVDGTDGNITLNGGTLGGIGTVGNITANGGTINPGSPASGPGKLTANNVTISSGSGFNEDMTSLVQGTGYDFLNALGTVSLNGTLTGTRGSFKPHIGDTLTIIQTAQPPLAGSFSGIANGGNIYIQGFNFTVSYTSNSVTLTHIQGASTTTVSSSANPSVFGQSVTFTATVAPAVGGGGSAPTGTAVFTVDGQQVASVTLDSNGNATYTTNTLSVAGSPHSVSVSYGGDTDFTSSSGSLTAGQTVNKDNSSIAVTSSDQPSVYGETVTFTATVSAAAPGSGTPTGTVTFTIDGATQSPVTLTSGAATATATFTVLGTHTVTVSYSGDGNFNLSTTISAFTQTVNKANTTTATVTASPSSPVFGQAVTFTTTVTVNGPGSGTPTGVVTFLDGGAAIGTGSVGAGGLATFTTSALLAGSHTITASYSGDPNFNSSTTANSFTLTVNQDSTTTSVSPSVNPSVYGQTVIFTATVMANSPGAGTPTGSVTFNVDGVTHTANLTGGQGTYSTTALGVGPHSIYVSYGGDSNFFASTSSTLSQTVNQANSTVAVTPSVNPAVVGQTVIFTATVAAVSPGSGTPTGSVTFTIDGTPQAPVTLTNGSGTVSTSFTSATVHTISVTYSGDGNFIAPASPTTFSEPVNKANTATAKVNSSAASITFGQTVTLSTTVTSVAPGSGTPTGIVTFFVGTTVLGTGTLDGSGFASYQTTVGQLPAGSDSLTASYGGDSNYNTSDSSASPFTETVSKASTTTANVTSSNPNSNVGDTVTFTTTITVLSPGAGTPTGTVTFLDSGVSIGTGTLASNGTATLATSALSAGTHSITASYGGDGNFNGSASVGSVTQVVNKVNSTSTITPSAEPAVFGQSVTLTVTVSGSTGTGVVPTGTATFTVDGVQQPTQTLTGGQATYTSSSLAIGSHSVSVSYSGDSNFNSSSATFTEDINQASTTTSVTSSANPSVFGQSVTYTGTVSAVAPGAGTPTGSVSFLDNGVTIDTTTLTNGSATFSPASLSVGAHTITLTYGGDTNFQANSSATPLTQTVSKASTTTSNVTSSNASPVYGQAVTFTATVTVSSPGVGTPTGTVTFFDGVTSLGTGTLNGNTATFTTTTLGAGSHSILASYNGDSNFSGSGSVSGLNQIVKQDSTTTSAVTSSNASPVFGQTVTFTTTVSAVAPGSGTPTGTVTFLDGATSLGTGTLSNGTATFSTSDLAAGSHSITASYGGDSNFLASSSKSALAQSVAKASSTTSANASPTASVFGQTVSITVSVAAVSPGSGAPTGSISFLDGSVSIGSATLTGGSATFTTTALGAGSHSISVDYLGSSNFTASSTSVSVTVNKASTATSAITSSLNPSLFGQAVSLSVTVSAVSPGSGTPTGTVAFTVDGTTSNVTLDATGKATFMPALLQAGTHTITAAYTGDANFLGSSSPTAFTQNVNQQSTTTSLTASPAPSSFGTTVTFTATVVGVGGIPSGSVTFEDSGTVLATVAMVVNTGKATFSAAALSVGSHTITAVYSGDTNFLASTGTLTEVINKASTTVGLTSDRQVAVIGRNVTFTATVSAVAPATGTPTGTVTFSDGSTAIGTVTLSGGQATLVYVFPGSAGAHSITASYNGDANFGTSSSAALTQNVYTLNQAFVAQTYLDLLNRTVDSFGLQTWTAALDAGATRTQVAAAIETSLEYRRDQVDAMYVKYLHRHAEEPSLTNFAMAIQGGATVEAIAAILIGSPEYFNNRGGGTNLGFLNALYNDVLGRNIDPTGQAADLLLLEQFTPRSAIAALVLTSPEARTDLVESYYPEFLRRPADPTGLNSFVGALLSGVRDESIIAILVGSDEYLNRL
jgi:autotransporter-associated beta strand protein